MGRRETTYSYNISCYFIFRQEELRDVSALFPNLPGKEEFTVDEPELRHNSSPFMVIQNTAHLQSMVKALHFVTNMADTSIFIVRYLNKNKIKKSVLSQNLFI